MSKREAWVTGRLSYNCENDRYGLIQGAQWMNEGFHCGDGLQVMIDGEWVDTAVEMSWDENGGAWYLVGTPYRRNLENVSARIKK